MADPILKTHAAQAAQQLERAGDLLRGRQAGVTSGAARGNVAARAGAEDLDFHGTLAAVWIWARHQLLAADARFAPARADAWGFVERTWRKFVPEAIGPDVGDEAAYDCAMVLRAATAERALGTSDADEGLGGGLAGEAAALAGGAARVLAAYLGELEALSGREFQDPGFLAWSLIDYARAEGERGLLAAGRRFVERAFGMKAPPPFSAEPEVSGGLFDFSSTTAMRVLAVMASEGATPFVGAWLRERVAESVPTSFVRRNLDERCWNACVATLAGRAYVVSTDPLFLEAYRNISGELARRDRGEDDTRGIFYGALAADALVRTEASMPDALGRNAHGR